MNKAKKSILAAAILLVFIIMMLVYAIPTQISTSNILGSASTMDSRWFPTVVSVLIGLLAAFELVTNIIKLKNEKSSENADNVESADKKGMIKSLAVFALFVLYLVLFANFGFIISSILVPPVVLFILGGRKWQYYLCYFIVVAITYVIFMYALNIMLP